jgi:hypothetical protein
MNFKIVPSPKKKKAAVSTALSDLLVPFGMEYLYVAVSKQKPGVCKCGRTGRNPFVRVKEFSDISLLVTWAVRAIIPVQDSTRAEALMQRHLDAEAVRDIAGKELWVIEPQRAEELARLAASLTPAKVRAKRLWTPENSAIARRNPHAWRLALALPVKCKTLCQEPVTLAELMGFIVNPSTRHSAERVLRKHGVVLTCFDEKEPRFHVHVDEDSDLTNWMRANGLGWEQFGAHVGGCVCETFDIVSLNELPEVAA